MKRNEAKQAADRVITVSNPEEIHNYFSGLLAAIGLSNLKNHGFYAFTFNGADSSVERVFMEVA